MRTRAKIGWAVLAATLVASAARAQYPACTAARFNDWKDLGCRMTPGGWGSFESGAVGQGGNQAQCMPCQGMPAWWVSEPYVNLWVADEPLGYTTSSGQRMAFRFTHRQRYELPAIYSFDHRYNDSLRAPAERLGTYYQDMRTLRFTNTTAWGWNWLADIVFWNWRWETNYANSSFPPAPSYSSGWEGLRFRPEGGVDYFTQTMPGDARTGQAIEPLGVLGYPVVTNPVAGTDGLYWGGDHTNGFRVRFPDGSQELFGLTFPIPGLPHDTQARAFLTQRIDPQGRVTRVGYEWANGNDGVPWYVYRPKHIVDHDGRTNIIRYQSNQRWRLQEIEDPYGRKALFQYAWNGQLTRIVDAAGLTNTLAYQTLAVPPFSRDAGGQPQWFTNWVAFAITNLTTPYGTTRFDYHQVWETNSTEAFYQQRSMLVTHPNQAHELFHYRHRTDPFVPAVITPEPVVSGFEFDNGATGTDHPQFYHRNSFHWGPRQFAAITGASPLEWTWPGGSLSYALGQLNAADFQKARLQHWRLGNDGISATETLSARREPSPDAQGQVSGPWTWYAYHGQSPSSVNREPGDPRVNCEARVLPDGTTQFTRVDYNYYAHYPSTRIESYTKTDGALGQRTNHYTYAYPNWPNLVAMSAAGLTNARVGWNTNHQPLFLTNALDEVTRFTYDAYTRHLTSVVRPGGATNTFTSYGSNPASPNGGMLHTVALQPQGRVLTFTWTNGLPHTVSDDRGLVVTNTWDGLNRLTSTSYPDGTYESNVYSRLDLVAMRDRLGHWTYAGYDSLGRLTTLTNANQAITRLGWCDCGSLETITNALNHITTFFHDNQGQLTQVVRPDSTVTYQRDALGRVTNTVDGSGRNLRLAYNNQGLLSSMSNAFGRLWSVAHDEHDRPARVTDALGVTTTNSYDALHRLLSRSWPGGSEGYLWRSNGLAAFTNANQQVTRYTRDGAGRLTAFTNANDEIVRFGYNSLNQLTELWDGRTNHTAWQHDVEGRLTHKFDALNNLVLQLGWDAAGRVTNRWTPQFGDTAYAHDAIGNLTAILHPQSSILYSYDALNQLTNLLDAVGETRFTWTSGGQLESEDGPWSDDTVTRSYTQRLRTGLTLNTPPSTLNWGYTHDSAWRLETLTSPAGNFGYDYSVAQASGLWGRLTLPNLARITNHFDALGRLDATALVNTWGHVLDGYGYTHDPLGLRTNVTRDLGWTGSSAEAGYDPIGQLTHWSAKETSGTPRIQEQLGWTYDPAGNLRYRTNNALVQTFVTDERNRLETITRTGTLTVSGNTPAPASSVTVNGQTAERYGDWTFASPGHGLINGTNTFTVVANNAGVLGSVTNTLHSYLPSTFNCLYDANGNLTNDGLRGFTYDAENQMTNVSVAGQWQSQFVYDGLGRKRIERDYTWTGGAWQQTNEVRFVYDGMVVLQERQFDPRLSTNDPQQVVTYTRGLDLSGTRQGAGGIGGLLARTDASGSAYYHSDGAGNVTALMDAQQHIVARYLYDPFGRQLGQWGELADANHYRFSSKEVHPQSGLYYYGFRHYDPALQRWLTEDPIGEAGGINLYRFVGNSPLNAVDPFGLFGLGPDDSFLDEMAEDLVGLGTWVYGKIHQGWDYALDQITPPIDPNQHPYLDAAAQTARDISLDALLFLATEGAGRSLKRPCSPRAAPRPNPDLLDQMCKRYHPGTDCSEIAEAMKKAAGDRGQILRVEPPKRGNLKLLEDGAVSSDNLYHDVFTDGAYVYDPRYSQMPVLKGDWERMIQEMNPEAVIKPR